MGISITLFLFAGISTEMYWATMKVRGLEQWHCFDCQDVQLPILESTRVTDTSGVDSKFFTKSVILTVIEILHDENDININC